MSSYLESVELKVTSFDKTEKEAETELPDLSYKKAFEYFQPQVGCSWSKWSVKNKEKNSTTI